MDKLKPIKHSLADWDFNPAGLLSITEEQYVSSPSSLTTGTAGTSGWRDWAFLKTALGACIPDGKFLEYWRYSHTSYDEHMVYFRTQALPIDSMPADCYYFRTTSSEWKLLRRVDDHDTELDGGTYPTEIPAHTWVHFRITFYQYLNAPLNNVLRIICEIDKGEGWETLTEVDDTNNQWAESEVNRIGFAIQSYRDTERCYIDNTEIWRRC